MTYYNPSVYNYANLDEQDQLVVKNAIRLVDSVHCMKEDYEIDANTLTMARIFNETANEVIDEIIERLSAEIVEYIVSRIDAYDHEVEQYDTDDYLYGFNSLLFDNSNNSSTN